MAKKTFNKTPVIWLSIAVTTLIFSFTLLLKNGRTPCANSLSCKESLEFEVNNNESAVFNGNKFQPPQIDTLDGFANTQVLGESDSIGSKHIYVDLSTQTLKAYEGAELFFETRVATGKWYPTPTGDFKIWKMVRSTKMSGGEGADYYYLPNVPYVMFFHNDKISAGRGFSLHGVYWHNNFGHVMSHGCVNMRTIDAKKIFEWLNSSGSDISDVVTVTIYGKAT